MRQRYFSFILLLPLFMIAVKQATSQLSEYVKCTEHCTRYVLLLEGKTET